MLMEPIERPAVRATDRAGLAFALLLGAAVAARLWAIDADGFFHPDEIIQYLEQAHRLAFGYGLEPWEYRYGMRGWLLPLLLAGPMRLGDALAPGSDLYLLLPRLLSAAIALVAVPAAYAIGARAGRLHAIVAMTAMALWYESVAFAAHVLTEPLATALFLAAAALLLGAEGRARRQAAAGALLALGVLLRFHYAPAAGLFAILALRGDRRAWRGVAAGGAAMLLLSGAIDLAMGQAPFGWMIENVRQNLIEGRADGYGRLAPADYLAMIWVQWGPLTVPMLLLMAPVARRYPALFWAAIVNLAVHMTIGHKEYRFICLTTQIFMLLAAIGSAELVSRLPEERQRRAGGRALVVAWGLASLALALARPMPPYAEDFAAKLRVARAAGRDTALCGIAIWGTPYWAVGGYAYVHRAVPLYLPRRLRRADERADFLRGIPAYNGVIAPAAGSLSRQTLYRPAMCDGNDPTHLCLWVRPGACTPAAARDFEIQRQLERLDS